MDANVSNVLFTELREDLLMHRQKDIDLSNKFELPDWFHKDVLLLHPQCFVDEDSLRVAIDHAIGFPKNAGLLQVRQVYDRFESHGNTRSFPWVTKHPVEMDSTDRFQLLNAKVLEGIDRVVMTVHFKD